MKGKNMSAQIIDGRIIAQKMRENIKVRVAQLPSKPGLAVVLVGHDPSSTTYVNMKKRACAAAGIQSFSHELPADIAEQELLTLITTLNNQHNVHGILVQLPLPPQIDTAKIIKAIDPCKDVDGFHPLSEHVACTPGGIIALIESTGVTIRGKKAVIVGRSHIVGKPTAMLLLNRDATVTICHRYTQTLALETKQADILVVAVGQPQMITGDMVKPGALVMDVGINRIKDTTGKKRLVGDVDFATVQPVAGFLTPVPGGVGPMTIAILLQNTVTAFLRRASRLGDHD
jgi:methylenetetrahydrofolate dehydrogenase (NADP+) / methenyltetrahydrofolate cyclohydrolase